MIKRIIKLFTDRKYWVRLIAIAGLSGGVAWFLGDLLIQDGGVVAAIVSTLSIRISLHKSLREGFGQIVGTAIGAGIALLTVSLFSFGFLAIATTMFWEQLLKSVYPAKFKLSVNEKFSKRSKPGQDISP